MVFTYFQIDYDTHFARIANFSYDAEGKRFRRLEFLLEGETRAIRLEIFLHAQVSLPETTMHAYVESSFSNSFQGKLYNATLSRDGKVVSCRTEPLTRPFEPIEVPPEATHAGQLYMGSEITSAGVLVDVWTASTDRGELYIYTYTD